MDDALSREPKALSEVIDQLSDVQRAFDAKPGPRSTDGIKYFNSLYSDITGRIYERYHAGAFRDPGFMNLLAVEFARRYISALHSWYTSDIAIPAAWSILFQRHNDAGPRPLIFAVAGVNAHINYDLPFALTLTWRQLGIAVNGSPQHDDFMQVNQIFGEAIPELRNSSVLSRQLRAQTHKGDLVDRCLARIVESARARAWSRAQHLWRLQTDPNGFAREQASLDRKTAAIGRLLLSSHLPG